MTNVTPHMLTIPLFETFISTQRPSRSQINHELHHYGVTYEHRHVKIPEAAQTAFGNLVQDCPYFLAVIRVLFQFCFSYHHLSPSNYAFVSAISIISNLKTFQEALSHPD